MHLLSKYFASLTEISAEECSAPMTDRPKKLNGLWRRSSHSGAGESPPVDAPPPIPSSITPAAANATIVMIEAEVPKCSRRRPFALPAESPPSDPEMLSVDDAEIAAVQQLDSTSNNDADAAAEPVGDLPVIADAQRSASSATQPDRDHRQRILDPILRKTTPDYGSFFDARARAVDRRSYRSNLRISTEEDYERATGPEVGQRPAHQSLHFVDDDGSLSDAILERMERERRRRRAHSTHFELRTPDDHLLKSGSSETESISRPLPRQALQRDGLSRSMPKLAQSMRISRHPTERLRPTCAPRPAQSWLHLPQMPASSNCNRFVHAMNNFPPGQHQSSRHPMQGPARNIFAYTTMQPLRQTAHKYPQMPDWQEQTQYGYQVRQQQATGPMARRVQRQESIACTADNVDSFASQRDRQLQADVFQDAGDDPAFFQQFSQPMPVQQTPVFVIPSVAGPPAMNIVGQTQWAGAYGTGGESSPTESSGSSGRSRRKNSNGRNCMLGWMLAVTAVIILALAIALFVQGWSLAALASLCLFSLIFELFSVSRDAQELSQLRAAVADDYQFDQNHQNGGQGLVKPTKPS